MSETKQDMATYTHTIIGAMVMHRPCASLARIVQQAFDYLADRGVKHIPDDYNFQYTGFAEFRWHDGETEHFGSSKCYIAMLCGDDGITIRGSIPKNPNAGHRDEGKIDVSGLAIADAMTLLAMLINVIRSPQPDGNRTPPVGA